MSVSAKTIAHPVRYWLVLGLLLAGMFLLAFRAVYLQVISSDYLQRQGNARHLRVVKENSQRGMILDRNAKPLAISTPIDSVWADPNEFVQARRHWPAIVRILDMSMKELSTLNKKYSGRNFMYLKRHVTPTVAKRIKKLKVPGIYLQREYRRYYPLGPVASHVIGFTNIDDQGQEGLELAYDAWLRSVAGKKSVLKDMRGNIVESVESILLPVPGNDLVTSLDWRIQYLAQRELKAALQRHKARSATAIVLDARTGEILAMVNQPDFNPNNRAHLRSALFRNRAVTDVFEPGSTLKPFTITAALESGKFTPRSIINTSPGMMRVGNKTITDKHDYGWMTPARIIQKSSNVGAARIALGFSKRKLWRLLRSVGFGSATGSGLPGESVGLLNPPSRWVTLDHAMMSFGYGISVTPLQLARAYTAFANDGVIVPVTLKRQTAAVKGKRVLSSATARQIRRMLELAVSDEGTGTAARVLHYRVAGKTGTVHKLLAGSYAEDSYIASFAGFAPASNPRLVMVVTVDDPTSGGYFGGQIAAPVFSKVMAGALRLLDITPDAPRNPAHWAAKTGHNGET